uniref:Uncharacterized protein n=1 Tax=Solanum lycopersicum TaxID=4081 RepID=A0A494GAC4_SOLLC
MSMKNDQHWFLYLLQLGNIITKWRENVSISVTNYMFGNVIHKWCSELLNSAYNYLLSYIYSNFVLALTIKNMIPAAPSKDIVIVIGVRDQCPFRRADGKPVDKYLDKKGEGCLL